MKSLSFFLAALNLLFAYKVSASCCSSGSTAGISRLLAHERAVVEFSQGLQKNIGYFDQKAAFFARTPSHKISWQFVQESSLMVRAADFFYPYIKVPTKISLSSEQAGASMGDISLGARWFLWPEGEWLALMPGLNLFSNWQLPTGASMEELALDEQIKASGLGAHLLSFGLSLEKTVYLVSYTLAYHLSFEPRLFQALGYSNGLGHSLSLAAAVPTHEAGTLSLSLASLLKSDASFNQKTIKESGQRKLSLSLGYAHKFNGHFSLNSSLGADLPITALGQNQSCEVLARLGLRLGVF